MEGSCRNPKLPQELREQLQELGIYACESSNQRTDLVTLEQRGEHLIKVLPLYIQVWTTSAYLFCHHYQIMSKHFFMFKEVKD